MTTRLKPDGKPMRALRVLQRGPQAACETDVWVATGQQTGQHWSAALDRLAAVGSAERGGLRGYHWYTITQAGRDYLASVDG